MKKLGIIAGGFKPFHVGHFSKVCLALQECDHVIISFGKGERKKGSELFYSRNMCQEVFPIVSQSLFESFGEKITTKIADVSPVRDVFGIIAARAFTPFEDDIGYDVDFIKSFDSLTVYGSEDDAEKYTRHFGTDKEEKYFGNLITNNQLFFETDSQFNKSADALNSNKHYHGQDWHFWDRLRVSQTRGTDVRQSVVQDDFNTFSNLMPLIFSDQQKQSLFNILKGGVNENAWCTHILSHRRS